MGGAGRGGEGVVSSIASTLNHSFNSFILWLFVHWMVVPLPGKIRTRKINRIIVVSCTAIFMHVCMWCVSAWLLVCTLYRVGSRREREKEGGGGRGFIERIINNGR